ncbi:hypothetical protein [Nitrosomonas supralitoralis]|uniref:Uncharacterized protein n=1 Tax=Nitrosomonas supralitoralis TaxID=2116706 RepID=A0A2P7NQY3_9PROT|nr:hypothetical protein [Nitrosomonas supralitoralis]PSJ15860.1 hypothetical protein C7H79_16695 [Nitrosomonas supralitoralis]
MDTIASLVDNYLTVERPVSVLLDPATVLAQAVVASKFYAGFAELVVNDGTEPPFPAITENTELSNSEWSVIKPLFVLYIERESAIHQEASRGLGLDVFGRSTSEIAQDIANLELNMPLNAFYQPIVTV